MARSQHRCRIPFLLGMLVDRRLPPRNGTSMNAAALQLVLTGGKSASGIVLVVAELEGGVVRELFMDLAWVRGSESAEAQDG